MRLSIVAPLIVAFGVAGCSKSADRNPANAAAQVWKIGNGAEPEDLDPQIVTGVTEHKLLMALFEGLVAEDPKDLHPVPGVAERWDVSADGKVYTFHLRANAKWSNGEPLTADDFIQSYKRILNPALGSEYANLIHDYVAGAKEYYDKKIADFDQVGFKAIDPQTLQVTLKNPTPYFLKILATHYSWYPVPIKVIAKAGPLDRKGNGWTKVGSFVGNGPFKLKEWSPNQRITVERNPHYWDAKTVKLDGIEFYAVESLAAEEAMFRTGQLDMTYQFPINKIDAYKAEHPDLLKIDKYLGVYFYRLNVEKVPLNDKRVRKALALAIDRESLVKNVTRGGELPAYTVSYPGTAGYTPRAKLSGDIAEAKRLLAEAGFPDGRGFPRLEILYNTHENHRSIAEAIQQMWKVNLGVDIGLTNQEWKVYLDMEDTGNYQIARAGWIADYVDPHVFLEIWTTGQGNNDTRWSNKEYDDLFQKSLTAKNDTDRYEIYQQMDAILVDELPVIPIYHYTKPYAISPRVKGHYPTLLDNHPYKYIWLEGK